MLVSAKARTVVQIRAIELLGLEPTRVLVEHRQRGSASQRRSRRITGYGTLCLGVVQDVACRGFSQSLHDLVDLFGNAHVGRSWLVSGVIINPGMLHLRWSMALGVARTFNAPSSAL